MQIHSDSHAQESNDNKNKSTSKWWRYKLDLWKLQMTNEIPTDSLTTQPVFDISSKQNHSSSATEMVNLKSWHLIKSSTIHWQTPLTLSSDVLKSGLNYVLICSWHISFIFLLYWLHTVVGYKGWRSDLWPVRDPAR